MSTTRAEKDPSDSPPFEPPKYTITVGDDNSLQWDPPPKSRELGLALSYHFPQETAMVDMMQAAHRKWLRHQLSEPMKTAKNSVSLVHGLGSTKPSTSAELGPRYFEKASHVNQEAENKRGAMVQGSESSPRKRSKIPGQITWRIGAGIEVTTKPKKRLYSKEKRDEVWKNRGKACEHYRRRKEKVRKFTLETI